MDRACGDRSVAPLEPPPNLTLEADPTPADLHRIRTPPDLSERRAIIPGMRHAFAAEPGIEPAPQTADAKLIDAAVTGWFRRYLR